ncbi:Alpha/Beta hydrolase protein, partial [Lineolata rhizophorae]
PAISERPSSADSIDMAVEAFLTHPRLSQKVRHPQTGRIISFSDVGDPKGYAVFCCVGMGLTRYVTAFYDELATSLKLRLITPDRPGVGESEAYPDGEGTPLSWPDDVLAICQALKITKFSLLAHSAGAIYALATALRLPQHIRGRVHLLAPWIPPSQMSPIGIHADAVPAGQLPRSQRFLRVLPTPFLKVANSGFMSATSASITRSVPKSPQNSASKKRKTGGNSPAANGGGAKSIPMDVAAPAPYNARRESILMMDRIAPSNSSLAVQDPHDPSHTGGGLGGGPWVDGPAALAAPTPSAAATPYHLSSPDRRARYDARLTSQTWDLATTHANPAVDLLVCLERHAPIGFRYVDITRAVVIHHGARDSRVPVDNVKWLGRTMRRCEVRILEGEGHGLMASAKVMANVLQEMSKEWEDWTAVVQGRGK